MTLRNEGGPWYKQRWPWILIAGPATVIVAGVITVWLAVVSNDGLVVDDYYKQGLAVNQRLQRDHEAANLGLHADVMRAEQNVRLMIRANGDIVLPDVLTLKLAHPTRAGHDQALALKAESPGFYGGRLGEGVTGRWLVTIEDPAGKWRLHGEWQADSGEPLRLVAKAD